MGGGNGKSDAEKVRELLGDRAADMVEDDEEDD